MWILEKGKLKLLSNSLSWFEIEAYMGEWYRQQTMFLVGRIITTLLLLELVACGGVSDGADVTASANITIDMITADDIVNAAEAAGDISVTGTVGGDAGFGDIVGLTVNGVDYSGRVNADNTFAIAVSGLDLANDVSFEVTVEGADTAGNPFSATTTSTHTVDTVASATITVDDITADDTVNAAEAAGDIYVSGKVGGDASAGDAVSFTVSDTNYSGVIAAGNTFSIPVSGIDLRNDSLFEITVDGSDAAGNPFTATTISTHSIDLIAIASISVDSISADEILDDIETVGLVNVTGRVGGEATAGDTVSFTVYFTDYSGLVLAGNVFSIPVFGYDLSNDDSFDITVEGSDSAGNAFRETTTSPIPSIPRLR
jgi:hypothetical protein